MAVTRMDHLPKATTSLVVHPDARGNGVGTALLGQAIDLAQREGADRVESIGYQPAGISCSVRKVL